MAMKRTNLPEVVPELFEHEQFGQFRFIKRGEEIWFVAIDLCRVLGYKNGSRDVNRHVDKDDQKIITRKQWEQMASNQESTVSVPFFSDEDMGGTQRLILVNEAGMYSLIFGSQLPAAKKFKRWVTHEVLPAIRKYGFYRVQQPEQEKVYVEITGDKYFKLFKAKYPEIDFDKALRILDFAEIYDETGHYHEETVYRLRLNPDEYAKLRLDVLSLQCLEQLAPHKNYRISQATLQTKINA